MESGWNATALYDVFLKGLSAPIQDLLVPLDLPTDVDALIALAIQTDNRLVQLRKQRGGGPAVTERHSRPPPPSGQAYRRSPPEPQPYLRADHEEEPMQLGRARLTPEERRKRQLEGRCFYCGEIVHLVVSCPAKGSQAVSHVTASHHVPRTLTNVTIIHRTVSDREALIDSGADESLMSWGLAKELGVNSERLAEPIRARSLNGKELFAITHINEPVRMQIDNHQEHIRFYLFTSSSHSLILGQPWLVLHNPHIDWKTGRITKWGIGCAKNCAISDKQKKDVAEINLFSTNPATDTEYPDLSSVPSHYHRLQKVFSKTKALSLPPHRPYDCAIDLIPGSSIPKGRLYSVSGPEREALKDYISASLEAGLIRPSSSPVGAGFFLCGKEGRFSQTLY